MRYVMTWDGSGEAPAGVERHCPILWNKWEYQPGVYDYAAIDRVLDARPGPCHLQIVISMYGEKTGLVDYTPNFYRKTLRATASNGKTGEIPNYADPSWRTWYWRAIEALAARYRDHPQVASYQLALGLDQETQATAVMPDGTDWNKAFAGALAEPQYYFFINESVRRTVAAWAPKPVYVPGAPAPGTTWGHTRRDVVIQALQDGGRYLMCGLLPDNSNATGLGGHQGKGLTDIIANAKGCAFEGGKEGAKSANDSAAGGAGELYWMLLRARQWGADFVQLQRSWIENASGAGDGYWAKAQALLPPDDSTGSCCRWIVFRDSEWPAPTFTGADGKEYGFTGEIGPWGKGLRLVDLAGGELVFDKSRYDFGRWRLRAKGPVELRADDLPDGWYELRVWPTEGAATVNHVQISGGRVVLPADGSYHRVEVHSLPKPDATGPTNVDEALRAAAEAHDVLPLNESAALFRAALAIGGLYPTSDEFEVDFAGITYVAQRFRRGGSADVVVLYCVKGDWDNILATSGS